MNKPVSYAPRVSITWAEFETCASVWAERCEAMAVYEHEADSSVSRTHCHILMLGCDVKAEQFKRIFRGALPGLNDRKGNDLWMWESKYGTPDDSFLKYMSKGRLRPKYVKTFSPELVEERRKQWKITIPKTDSPAKYDEYTVIKQQFFAQHNDSDLKFMNFESVRKWVFHWYYKRDGRVPIPTCYKRNSSSLMMAIGEKVNRFEEASNEVFNLWY